MKLAVVCAAFLTMTFAWSQTSDSPKVTVQYFGNPDVARLVAGAPGRATLLYYGPHYRPQLDAARPQLVVQLSRRPNEAAVARIFSAPDGLTYVPVTLRRNSVTTPQNLAPTLVMEAENGWWVRNGRISYNFDVQVYGGVEAMWGPKGWMERVQPDELSVTIRVRDPKHTGLPQWDLRQLVPTFGDSAYYRTNYAEKKCATPLKVELGASPQWPYVALSGMFEQLVGSLRPPIVVNWQTGKITHFTELVTVRNQNCSYALYSINPLAPDTVNEADFETPFAFYDLSRRGTGHPNLILRTERYPVGDRWFEEQQGNLPEDFETVRYSWRNEVGDWLWDYKVEVMGKHAYTFATPLADGFASVTAPSYKAFPSWVVTRAWPAVTFIDTEGAGYRSSEGIYDWSPRELGDRFLIGSQTEANRGAFSDIREGLRGEYRFRKDLKPVLYLSPIDNRLHLQGAEGGLWNLGGGVTMRVKNLSNDLYLDHWVLEGPTTRVSLTNLEGYLLFSDQGGVVLKKTTVPDQLFTTLPPVDEASWAEARRLLEPYKAARRDPYEMRSWLEVFPGPSVVLAGAKLSQLRVTPEGFRFALIVSGPVSGTLPIPALQNLAAGRYVATYVRAEDAWRIEAATPFRFEATMNVGAIPVLSPARFNLSLRNFGNSDTQASLMMQLNSANIKVWEGLLTGTDVTNVDFSWTPVQAGSWNMLLKVGKEVFPITSVEVSLPTRVVGVSAFHLSLGGPSNFLLALLLSVIFVLSFSLWQIWRPS